MPNSDGVLKTLFKLSLSNFWRYCACSLIYNFGAFLFWIVVPLCATNLDASNWDFAIINAINFGSCFVLSWVCGFINNYIPGSILARIGVVVYIIACVVLMFVNDNLWILWIMAISYGISYVLFWVPIQTSISRESNAGGAEVWLAIFSGMWTFGQALGYLAGAFLFTKLGIEQALAISIASLVIVFIIYPCWEGDSPFGIDLSLKKKTDEELEDHDDKKKKNQPILWKMGKKERRRMKKRTLKFLVPSFLCCIACYGNLLTYGSQYFNRIYDTKDGYFPSMEGEDDRYDIFIGVFFFTIYMTYTFGLFIFGYLKFMFFNRAIAYYFICLSVIMHFVCGTVSNWIAQLVSAVVLGLAGAYSFQNVLVTTSRLSMLTSNVSSLYVGLQESLTYNFIAFSLPLIVGPISDSAGDYRIPMFGCSVVSVICLVLSEISCQVYDFFIIRKMDKEDVKEVVQISDDLIESGQANEMIEDSEKYNLFCREHTLSLVQMKVLLNRLKRLQKNDQ